MKLERSVQHLLDFLRTSEREHLVSRAPKRVICLLVILLTTFSHYVVHLKVTCSSSGSWASCHCSTQVLPMQSRVYWTLLFIAWAVIALYVNDVSSSLNFRRVSSAPCRIAPQSRARRNLKLTTKTCYHSLFLPLSLPSLPYQNAHGMFRDNRKSPTMTAFNNFSTRLISCEMYDINM